MQLELILQIHPKILKYIKNNIIITIIKENATKYNAIFGIFVLLNNAISPQYNKLDNKKNKHTYYLQGYFHDKIRHLSYVLDFSDT